MRKPLPSKSKPKLTVIGSDATAKAMGADASSMASTEAPQIEFPCDYPIKVIGRAGDDFEALVLATVQPHCDPIDKKTVLAKQSRKGTFSSVNLTIVATGKPQIEAIFSDLKATGRVTTVL